MIASAYSYASFPEMRIMRLASPSYGCNPRFLSSISPLSVNPSDERSGATELYRGLIIPSRNDTGRKNDW